MMYRASDSIVLDRPLGSEMRALATRLPARSAMRSATYRRYGRLPAVDECRSVRLDQPDGTKSYTRRKDVTLKMERSGLRWPLHRGCLSAEVSVFFGFLYANARLR